MVTDSFNVVNCNQITNETSGSQIENILQQSTVAAAAQIKIPNPFNDSTLAYDSFSMRSNDTPVPVQMKNISYTEIENQFNMVSNPFVSPSSSSDTSWNQSNELNFSMNHTEFSPNTENYANLRNDVEIELSKSFGANTGNVKKEIPMDLFKDMAKAAFNEFNSIKTKNNEFYNKISAFDNVYNDTDGMKILLKN